MTRPVKARSFNKLDRALGGSPREKKLTIEIFSMKQYAHYLIGVLTAMVGYHIHGSFFWAVMDFFFYPFAIIKWLITHELTGSVIHDTFSFLLK